MNLTTFNAAITAQLRQQITTWYKTELSYTEAKELRCKFAKFVTSLQHELAPDLQALVNSFPTGPEAIDAAIDIYLAQVFFSVTMHHQNNDAGSKIPLRIRAYQCRLDHMLLKLRLLVEQSFSHGNEKYMPVRRFYRMVGNDAMAF